MKKLIYTVVALSFVAAAQTVHAAPACGSSSGASRFANTNVKAKVSISKPATRATVKRTRVTQ